LILAVGLNVRHAMNDYGVKESKLHIEAMACTAGNCCSDCTGVEPCSGFNCGSGAGDPSYDKWGYMYYDCNWADPSKGKYKYCFRGGYADSCSNTSC